MLGCQDFCGYYDWTFHFVRRSWGQQAVRQLWAEAIGGEAQQHYAQSASRAGLRGLYQQWTKTGVEESCDWTFTLDEARNVLRFDMRQCPSKGFLLANDLQADEDYCDHCMGWTVPLLSGVGVELIEHEHNHCGQCWGTMRGKDRPTQPLEVEADIRRDGRWNCGFLHRWRSDRPQPLLRSVSPSSDPCDVLAAWFEAANGLVILGPESAAPEACRSLVPGCALLTIGKIYADGRQCPIDPSAVLLGDERDELAGVAARFQATAAERRPLILHHFLPRGPMLDFVSAGLPRPVPILPLLIRRGLYRHQPGGPTPDLTELLMLLAAALQKPIP
jgi:hypothetical protein